MQWLDEPTARVLDFVLRRLESEPIGLVSGSRSSADRHTVSPIDGIADERITRIDPSGLSIDALDRLLRSRLELELPRPTLVRLRAVSAGNPFYALELGRVLGGAQVIDDHDTFEVPPSLDGLVGKRLDDLDHDAGEVALYAAAASHPTTDLISASVGEESAHHGLEAAAASGVLVVDGMAVRFTHPLLAEATYGRASAARRRVVHTRLAEVIAEPEERARHLARAATRPDEMVAAALEDAALAVSRRGAPDSAAELAERAADLTPETDRPARRRRRWLAAQELIVAGDIGRARAMLERLVEEAVEPQERVEALTRMAYLLLIQAEWDEARDLYQEAAAIVDDDPRRRFAIEYGLAGLAFVTWRGWREGPGHADEALRLAERIGDKTIVFQSLGHAASWRYVVGEDWRELMARADALASQAEDVPGVEHPDLQFSRLLRDAGDVEESERRIDRLIDYARDRGDWHGLPRLLLSKALLQATRGDIGSAEASLEAALTACSRPDTGRGCSTSHSCRIGSA